MNFRPLQADEIDVRVGGVYKSGVTFLLYKNARVDMAILDDTVGEFNWQRDHREIKGNLYCGIAIKDPSTNEWVWKWDCGTESNTEKEKGEASDSFKRAGFNWGIGRELYTAPLIYLPCATNPKPNGKGYEINNPAELRGIYASVFETEEVNGKRVISKLTLSQKAQGKNLDIFKWERR